MMTYRSAQSRNTGQFGPTVWPPSCWRNASSPPTSAVPTGGNSLLPKSFFPNSRYTGPAATAARLGSVGMVGGRRLGGVRRVLPGAALQRGEFGLEPSVLLAQKGVLGAELLHLIPQRDDLTLQDGQEVSVRAAATHTVRVGSAESQIQAASARPVCLPFR